jgi:hypothetical protein
MEEEEKEEEEDTIPLLQLTQSLPAVGGVRLLRIAGIHVGGRMWRWVSCRRGRHGEERGRLGGGGGGGGEEEDLEGDLEGDLEECVVCMEKIGPDQEVSSLKCRHAYHYGTHTHTHTHI